MHETNFDIQISNLSKIEGRANLDVKVRDGIVEDVKLKISENKRFYTRAVVGKPALSVPSIVARICGTCSIAHLTACIKAVEDAFALTPSEQTLELRKLALNGLIIRDHAMHLYLFSLPDIFGKDSILEFEGPLEKWVKQAFKVKSAGNSLCTTIAGKAVHPPFEVVGSFSRIPNAENVKQTITELKECRNDVIELIQAFHASDFVFDRETFFISLVNQDFNFLDGELESTSGTCIPKNSFFKYFKRIVIPYSQATGFTFQGQGYRVGALSRLNLNKKSLHKNTRKDAEKFLKKFPSNNIFDNNLAQAIETLHCIDSSVEKLETLEFKEEPRVEVKPRQGNGIGVIEAPRGTLYYALSTTQDGKISQADLVIPTQQNQVNMEKDIAELVNSLLKKKASKHQIQMEVEHLIRAYDPCMSCASHFLKINWL